MSSIAVTTPTTRLRLTARGRRVLALVAALPVVIVLAIAAVGGGAALASAETGETPTTFTEITVMSGETLWSIAEEVAPEADPRDVVAEITRLNALEGGSVSAGQRIAIPSEYLSAS